MKLSELVAELSAELIRDGDAELSNVSIEEPHNMGALKLYRKDGEIYMHFILSEEEVLARRRKIVEDRMHSVRRSYPSLSFGSSLSSADQRRTEQLYKLATYTAATTSKKVP